MVDTARVLITDALLDLGVLADEETPSASQLDGGLRKLNNMIDAWKIQNLLGYGALSYVKTLVPNQQIYTIGTGGDFDFDRPPAIQSAYIRSFAGAQSLDTPLKIYNDQEWQDVPLKQEAAQWPNYGIWFNYVYPLIQGFLNPIPTTSLYQLVIWVEGVIENLTVDQAVAMPPGYKRALGANLCIELAGSYGVQVPDTIATIARDSKADLKVQNFQPSLLSTASYGQYEITSNRIYIR